MSSPTNCVGVNRSQLCKSEKARGRLYRLTLRSPMMRGFMEANTRPELRLSLCLLVALGDSVDGK